MDTAGAAIPPPNGATKPLTICNSGFIGGGHFRKFDFSFFGLCQPDIRDYLTLTIAINVDI